MKATKRRGKERKKRKERKKKKDDGRGGKRERKKRGERGMRRTEESESEGGCVLGIKTKKGCGERDGGTSGGKESNLPVWWSSGGTDTR